MNAYVWDHIAGILQVFFALAGAGLFGKLWQAVGLLKTIELEIRNINHQMELANTRISVVETTTSLSVQDRQAIHIKIDDLNRRLEHVEKNIADLVSNGVNSD